MNKENLLVNSLRFLSAQAVEKANSGHPGLPLGAAPMAYSLWGKHLNINPKDHKWINRDRFILSAGHGSALLYSLLHLYGFDVTIEDLKNFRQIGSKTPGHPEYGHTHGVEATTGPLGQGISMAVGMAIAEAHLAEKYNKDDIKLIDHYTYSICGDGDLMEGIGYEALSLAGTLGLDKLILLYDSNSITIEGSTKIAFTEDVAKRMEAFGFQVLKVADGNDLEGIDKAIAEAKAEKSKPSIIIITTEIGYGVPKKVGSPSVHGSPLGGENIEEMKEFLAWDYEDFVVPDEVYDLAKAQVLEKEKVYKAWKDLEDQYAKKYPTDYENLQKALNKDLPADLFDEEYFSFDGSMASRKASGLSLNKIAAKLDYLVGGSADLGPSNNSEIKGESFFSKEDRAGRNLHFGVREHAMAAISNGIYLHGGLSTYVATFLVFSDYMKGAMRLSAIMKLPQIYILTHDSIGVGEDGPTHQPIEQISMMRTMPNFNVFRPADAVETAYAWKMAIESKETPTALALSRQGLKNLDGSGAGVERGAYVIAKETKDLDLIILASGSEVELAIEAKEILEKDGLGTRVVSVPCMEIFDSQDQAYKDQVLPKNVTKRISVEAGATGLWYKYIGLEGQALGLDRFGESGPGSQVYDYLGITTAKIVEIAKNM
ncbi:MAG: transketolase [Bacillota bacterium]|nr:transketolase [Bacillota bacterium]